MLAQDNHILSGGWYNKDMESLMRRIVKFLDPKLERFREKKPEVKFTPRSLEEFIGVIQRTPKSVLSAEERRRIAAVMSFDERKVGELMATKEKIVFVGEKEFLGSLMLDKLYKSGFTDFPVVDAKNKVKGVIHTEALNALEIKKTDRAEKYLDKKVYYLHVGDNLGFAIEEIERTGSFYFMVLDKNEELAGFFTVRQLLDYLIQ